jgi:tol-pal system protein YbgF
MQTLTRVILALSVAATWFVATPVFSESAPVYDVDAMPQQMDGSDANQPDYPLPPPPGQENAFVPVPSSNPAPVSNNLEQRRVNAAPLSTEQRLRKMEQQIANMQGSESSAQVEALQNQVQSLRGQVEELTHQLKQMQTQQKSMYSDLDKRLNSKKTSKSEVNSQEKSPEKTSEETDFSDEAGVIPSAPKSSRKTAQTKSDAKPSNAKASDEADASTPKSEEEQPNVAEEQQIYQTAYNLIKEKKYSEAVDALQSMLKKYPSGQFASNAHYWLGELYGLMGKNDQALSEFSTVVKSYPSSPRVADAQLKIGLIYATQSKWSDAKAAFKKVINRYPGSASSRLATEQLKQIKQAGH